MNGREVLFRLLRLSHKREIARRDCHSFLFLQFERALGQSIMMTSMYEALREAVPSADVTVAAGRMAYQVLRHNPNINRLIKVRDPISAPLSAAADIVRQISFRSPTFDCIATDSSNRRTKISLLSLLARARIRVGFTLAPSLYDVLLQYDFDKSVLANNLRVVEALGYPVNVREPTLYFSESDKAKADQFIRKEGLDRTRPLIAVATQVSGGYPEKRRWRASSFAEIADRIVDLGGQVVFLGTASEGAGIERIRALTKHPTVSAAGVFSIPELGAFLARCDLLLTLDTGALHVARAIGLPAVVIARPWQPPHEWLPLDNPRYLILSKREVVEQAKRDPHFDAPFTIDEISVDEVMTAMTTMLKSGQNSAKEQDIRLSSLCQTHSPLETV